MPTKKARVNVSKLIKSSGKAGERLLDSFKKEERRVDTLRIEDYRKMVNNDGQIQMLINAVTNTIISSGVTIEDDWENKEESEEKQFIEDCLFSSTWKGGMSIPMATTNRTMLRGFIEGYRLFEVVYKLGEDGKYRIDKLAPRGATTDAGMKIVVDDNGNFLGFHQNIKWANERIDVVVKNEGEIIKVVKPTFGEEFGSLYGRSGLKSAWYHYDKVHKAMYLNHVGHEFGASKFCYIKTKGNMSEDELDNMLEDLSKIHQKSNFAAPENKVELLFESLSDPAVMEVGKEMINLHYSLIAKSILAQFIDLGSDVSNTGSRALGESQTDFFKEGLQNIATILIEEPWNKVIATLIKLNFDNDIYPKLRVNKIADNTNQLLYAALMKLVEKGNITESLKREIMILGSEKVGIDLDEEEITKEMEESEQKKDDFENRKLDNTSKMQIPIKAVKGKKQVELAEEVKEVRELYPDEEVVKWVDIKKKLDYTEDRAKVILRGKLERQKENIIQRYIEALRSGRKSIRKVDIELEENETNYSQELYILALEMLEFGKIISANELDKAVPNTIRKDRQALEDEVEMVIEEQTARLRFRLQNVANEALLKELPENQVRLMLEEEYDSFFDTVLFPTIFVLIPKAMNWGIGITHKKYSKDIFAYRYTAVLDSRTTDFCRAMDGKVFQETDPDYAMLTPPNHYGCRSRWVAIMNKMQDKYNFRVDGKPTDIPVYSSVSTFKGSEDKFKQKENRIIKLIDSLNDRKDREINQKASKGEKDKI